MSTLNYSVSLLNCQAERLGELNFYGITTNDGIDTIRKANAYYVEIAGAVGVIRIIDIGVESNSAGARINTDS
jgi:hypothetical protein